MNPLEGKVVVVTGASDGIGASLTSALRARGARMTLCGRNEERLRAHAGPGDLTVAGDLTRSDTRVEIVERTIAHFGRVDVLINNAGRGAYYSALDSPLDDARSMFELNLFAPLHLAQLAAQQLRQNRGTIVNVSSIAGQITLPWLPLYSASKFALTSLAASLRMDLRQQGVHVMAVFPGYVHTGFQAHAAGEAPPARGVQGKCFAVTAEECARAIVGGIEQRRAVVVTPRIGWLLIWANRLWPSFIESRMETV